MARNSEIVITGLGLVTPLGLDCDSFWEALVTGRSGIGLFTAYELGQREPPPVALVERFDPQQYIKPRKSLKIMPRDSQLALAAAVLAREHAQLAGTVDPARLGVSYGADTITPTLPDSSQPYVGCLVDGQVQLERWTTHGMPATFPLNMLKLLPNMTGCHVSIAQDARGPNNTIYQGEVSSLLAVAEAARVIERGAADVMFAGAASSRLQPLDWVRALLTLELADAADDPAHACRPFAADRRGQVRGEGAAALVVESRRHAEQRGARVWARVLGWGTSCEVSREPGSGLQRAIVAALRMAGLAASDIGHVNAHGLATRDSDRLEARVLQDLLPDVAVTAPKSLFGNLAAAGGIVEAAVSVLALAHNLVPATLNYRQPDADCPLAVVTKPKVGLLPTALLVNFTPAGQAVALVLSR